MNSGNILQEKMATVYRRRHHLFVHASSMTTDGVWILTEPVFKLDAGSADAEIGSAIRLSLQHSHANVQHPTNWGGLLTPLLTQAGVKSWGRFIEGASCVIAVLKGETLSVIPTENLGSKGGFKHQLGASISLNSEATTDIGAAVRKLLG